MIINQSVLFIINILLLGIQGIAMWKAARQSQRNWFIALLFFNVFTLGILSVVYLFFFSVKRLTLNEIKGWVNRKE